LESGLEAAFGRGELDVHYQPIVSLDPRELVALEALVRWHHPQRGLLTAAAFLPAAQPPELLPALDLWVLEEACRLAATLPPPASGGPLLAMHVNFFPARLQDPQVVSRVARALEGSGLPADRLVVEISEKAMLYDPGSGARLRELRSLGVRIGLDDFGTGRASLAELHRIPADLIKIDRIFVEGLGRDARDTRLIEPLIAFGRTLGMQILAEGVERPEQAGALLELGCQLGQGYHFGRPVPRAALAEILPRHPGPPPAPGRG
jgi:EAL domain-containing protein (putative c-di-GMP-specific phosphodiesterase class I)